jgi:hypothetical protein
MQVSYNRLENPSKKLWCNRQAKRDRGIGSCVSGTPSFVSSPIPMSQTSDKEKFRLLSEEVQSLLLKRVIEEIPLTQLTPGFYSRLFLVPNELLPMM